MTPIVVLSGTGDEALATTAVREGAQDYLVKGHVDEFLLIALLDATRSNAAKELEAHRRRSPSTTRGTGFRTVSRSC